MSDLAWISELKPGDRICVMGWGMAIRVHEHHEVMRLTRTQVISGRISDKMIRRHRIKDGNSVGSGDRGGTFICQHEKEA